MSSQTHKSQENPKHTEFHPRNRHQGQYDFAALIAADQDSGVSALGHFVHPNSYGDLSIDFTNPIAVKALNRALLKLQYGVKAWDIPTDYLCPPVPGRADYIHGLADLLIAANQGKSPKKNSVHVVDIGTGANGIYPLVGSHEYDWNFVAADINPDSLANLQNIIQANPGLLPKIELRLQKDRHHIFHNIMHQDEWFDLSMCNPPFHASAAEALSGTERKWQNLGKTRSHANSNLNFGGQNAELWCDGGELTFIQDMIRESQDFATHCFWFTSLVSKASHLPAINAALKRAQVKQSKTINMRQGQKQSRFVAWSFLNPAQQSAWAKMRWQK